VRQAAARLGRSVRAVDPVARLGGDEFAVILAGIKDARIAEDKCQLLLQQFSLPFQLVDDQVFIGVSIGVAIAPDSAADSEDLLRKADIALYEAKRNGRGRYQVFAGDMDDIVLRKRLIESELRAALTSGDQISLQYQPVYAADCHTVLGAEALIRWRHPVHGELPPAHFISIAEERGMIGMLGDHVLREVARFGAASSLPWISVNVSPLQLRDEGFTANLLAIIAEAGLAPSRLQVEITENVLLENSETTRIALSELRAKGIAVALDDFGTGYSSINYLRRHAIDKLKIDRSFVRLLEGDRQSAAIVKALIDVARAVRVKVTAEGVETEEQKDRLVAMGCDELQGFLLSPPLDAETLLSQSLQADGGRAASVV
jgi:predicted signal transduction protein with EAL and GGDEF domain